MEKVPTRLETLLPKILEQFATELEDCYTTPGNWHDVNPEHIEMIRKGIKIPQANDKRELLVRIGQDFRLTPDEIDELQTRVFES